MKNTSQTDISPSYRSIDKSAQLMKINEIIDLANSSGINTQGTRISRYKKYLECNFIDQKINHLDIFKSLRDREISPVEWEVYITKEIGELDWITKSLCKTKPPGYEEKLKEIFSGSDFSVFDKDPKPRNTQFELKIAQYYTDENIESDFSTKTDAILNYRKFKLHIECKRLESETKVRKNILEAKDQLLRRMPTGFFSRPSYGLIAIDVTNIIFPKGEIIFCNYQSELKEFLMSKLKSLADRIDYLPRVFSHKQILGIHFHVHIPYCSITPKLYGSRLSNFVLLNDRTNGSARKAISIIQDTQKSVIAKEEQSNQIVNITLNPPDVSKGIYIDGFNESAITSYIENDPSKYVSSKPEILWGHLPNGDKFSFTMLELWKLGESVRKIMIEKDVENPVAFLAYYMLHLFPKYEVT